MSQYYKPDRKQDWNYGGAKWRLSRSKIDLFIECPLCFYIDNKLGTARPPGYPFSLNAAVDKLLKKEFDIHRAKNTRHPLCEAYGIEAVPFSHPKLDTWRENFKGVEYKHAPTGFTVSGAVDDVWINPKGELHVVDYKATSKDGEVTLDADWQDGYKRQMEVYQWLLRKNGFTVSDTGYFVYVNGRTDAEAFDGKLEFDVKLIPYTGSDSWIEKTLLDIKACLTSDDIPVSGDECDYCPYRDAAGKKLQSLVVKKAVAHTKSTEPVTPRKNHARSLFE
ncbi:MAG: PD-(D/E)XK nuclease family protein [Patescibacteria group bacterium]|nr:PD-(D/E)XK nuclease family protein [Patescibacteria group bacterium]